MMIYVCNYCGKQFKSGLWGFGAKLMIGNECHGGCVLEDGASDDGKYVICVSCRGNIIGLFERAFKKVSNQVRLQFKETTEKLK